MPLPWKSAWITGASTGIGRELALALARREVVVAASARSREGRGNLAAEAGTYVPMSAAGFDSARFRDHVEVNLMGVVHALEALLPAYLAAPRGHIAIIASVAGYRGLPTGAAYGATKAALINLAESLKYELDRAGVKLQLVNPGFVETPLTGKNDFKLPFLMPAEKAAERMIAGFLSRRFEITFPRRFTWQLKLLRLLPYRLYFAITRRRAGA